jgi:hypothetical protein
VRWLALPTLAWAFLGCTTSRNFGLALTIAAGCVGFLLQATRENRATPGSLRPAPLMGMLVMVALAWIGPSLVGGHQWARVALPDFHIGLIVVPWIVLQLAEWQGVDNPGHPIQSDGT